MELSWRLVTEGCLHAIAQNTLKWAFHALYVSKNTILTKSFVSAVCTALQAICHIASSELVDVFLPQVRSGFMDLLLVQKELYQSA